MNFEVPEFYRVALICTEEFELQTFLDPSGQVESQIEKCQLNPTVPKVT